MVWKTGKRIRKTIRNVSEKLQAPLTPLKHFSPALFWKFFITQNLHKTFFSPQGSAGVAALKSVEKYFSTLFDCFRAGQKSSKIVFDTLRQFPHDIDFPASFGGIWVFFFDPNLAKSDVGKGTGQKVSRQPLGIFWCKNSPRGPNDQTNLIPIEIFDLDRNFWSRSKISISTSRFPHKK